MAAPDSDSRVHKHRHVSAHEGAGHCGSPLTMLEWAVRGSVLLWHDPCHLPCSFPWGKTPLVHSVPFSWAGADLWNSSFYTVGVWMP